VYGSTDADARAFVRFAQAVGLGPRDGATTFPPSFFRAGIFAALRELHELRLMVLAYADGGKPDVLPGYDHTALVVLDALYSGLTELDDLHTAD
jgi:hypothetical protein